MAILYTIKLVIFVHFTTILYYFLFTPVIPLLACGGLRTQDSGLVRSPGYPHRYPHNRNCVWKIHSASGTKITLNVTNFRLENRNRRTKTCTYDYLEIRYPLYFVLHRSLMTFALLDINHMFIFQIPALKIMYSRFNFLKYILHLYFLRNKNTLHIAQCPSQYLYTFIHGHIES